MPRCACCGPAVAPVRSEWSPHWGAPAPPGEQHAAPRCTSVHDRGGRQHVSLGSWPGPRCLPACVYSVRGFCQRLCGLFPWCLHAQWMLVTTRCHQQSAVPPTPPPLILHTQHGPLPARAPGRHSQAHARLRRPPLFPAQRLILFAAKCGLPLPVPPPPHYHVPYSKAPPGTKLDPALSSLVGGGLWRSLSVCSKVRVVGLCAWCGWVYWWWCWGGATVCLFHTHCLSLSNYACLPARLLA